MSSKIMIRCDVCTGNYPPEKIKAIRISTTSDEILWLNKPEIDSEHFICHDCLERIGWKEEKPSDLSDPFDLSDKSVKSEETEKPADTPNAAGSSENNTSPAI